MIHYLNTIINYIKQYYVNTITIDYCMDIIYLNLLYIINYIIINELLI